MYPLELVIKNTMESNTSASYLDLLLSIRRDGQLSTSLYGKRDNFNFHVTNFLFMSNNIQFSPAYGVYISKLIRYARARSSCEYFIMRAMQLSNNLCGQGYVTERLKLSLRKFYGQVRGFHQTIWGPPLPIYTKFWRMTIYSDTLHWSDISQIWSCNWSGPYCRIFVFTYLCEVTIEHLQWVRHDNRGRLLLWTPGPVPFWDLYVLKYWDLSLLNLFCFRTFEFRTPWR